MRTSIITTEMRFTLIRRILITCAAVAAISASTIASVSQGEDPPPGPPTEIMITYFGAVSIGPDEWFIDGTLTAEDMSAVTITFGKAGSGTTTPDPYGYFSVEMSAAAGSIVSMDATDGTSSAYAEVTLDSFEL